MVPKIKRSGVFSTTKYELFIELYILFILLFFATPSSPEQDFNKDKFKDWEMSALVPDRLLEIMRTYLIDAEKRTVEMNPMRFMYEESPYYEQGYVMGEIIERYKKMVEHVKRPMEFKADSVFATLKRTELIQKLYFEIYHLVNMAHEIPKKYSYIEEFREMLNPVDLEEVLKHEQWIKDNERQRKIHMKMEKKRMKQMRELYLKMKIKTYEPVAKKKYNKWWPIDYGWEIDYYW